MPPFIRRIKPVIVKEFRQVARDRISLGILLLIPAFLMFMIGYALNFDVKHVTLAVYDNDKSQASREFARKFTNSGYFDIVASPSDYREIDALLNGGKARAALVIPDDFSKNLLADREAVVQVIMDGSNANTATAALGYMNTIIQTYSAGVRTDFMARKGIQAYEPIDLRPKVWYNPELSSPKFLVPGFIGFILMMSSVVSTALSVVREKEQGTMEQLTVSPLGIPEVIIGKTVPYLLIALVSSVLVLLMGHLFFHVTIRGEIGWLYLGIVMFILAALGQGLLISSVAQTQQVAFMMAILSSILPTFLLSGLVFPIRSMPYALQVISNITPTKFFIIIIRDVMLKGAGPAVFWHELLYLLLFATITISIAARKMAQQRRAA
ncbi:MAG: ABC transporter permease [Nitrospinae bacterium]|nr:ABC transporter permease [Nitrospinota bacterium]